MTTVKTIETWNKGLGEASSGEFVGINLKNLAVRDLKKGFVISAVDSDPVYPDESFVA